MPSRYTREESLVSRMTSLVRGGSTMRSAWGITMVTIARVWDMPSERAASYWPGGTACRPARSDSAMYAAATTPRAIITVT